MFQRTISRFAQIATTVIAVALMASIATAQNPAGLIFAQAGSLKAALKKVGSIKGPVPASTMEYGPRGGVGGVPQDGFRLMIDDGFDVLTLTGTYTFDGNKKIVLTPDPASIASDLEDLIEFQGGLAPGDSNVDCVSVNKKNKAKAKAKVKNKKGIVTSSTSVKLSCLVSIVGFPDTLTIKFGYKGKKGSQL